MACLVTYLADSKKKSDLIVSGKRISFRGGVPVEVDDFVGTSILQMPRKHLYKVEFIRPVEQAVDSYVEPAPVFNKTKTARKVRQRKIS